MAKNSRPGLSQDELKQFFPLSTEQSALQFSEAIPVGTYIMKVDAQGVPSFTFASQRFLHMLDLDRKKVLADPNYVYGAVHPDDYASLLAVSRHIQKNVLPFYWEGRFFVRGEIRWFLCESVPRKLSDGSVLWEGATTDITRQKAAEQELVRRNQQSVELLQNTPFPMAINSLHDGRITFLNKAFTALFGYTQAEVPRVQDWAELAYPDPVYRQQTFDWWDQALSDYLEQGTPLPNKVIQARTKSGDTVDIVISATVVNDELILSFLDVSESQKALRELKEQQQDAINQALHRIERAESNMLGSLISLALERDNETGQHIVRTQQYVQRLALRLRDMGHYAEQLSDQKIDQMVKVAPLHDIGKVGIPDAILQKPGKLTDDEWSIMKTHTTIGERVLGASEVQSHLEDNLLQTAVAIAGCHHEKWDGSGYPKGLKAQDIPLAARIMALADIYDALTSVRVYKDKWSTAQAQEEILQRRGTHLDPWVVDAFLLEQDEFARIAKELGDEAASGLQAQALLCLNALQAARTKALVNVLTSRLRPTDGWLATRVCKRHALNTASS